MTETAIQEIANMTAAQFSRYLRLRASGVALQEAIAQAKS